MENDKIFELIEKFYAEIESTKVEFTEKVETRLNEIEQKLSSQKEEDLSSSEGALAANSSVDSLQKDIAVKIDEFTDTFEEINETIGLQALTISNLTKICKALIATSSVSLLVALIILFK